MYPVALRGPAVLVRELRPDDFAAIRIYAEDDEVHRYLIWQRDDPEDTRAFIARAAETALADPRTDHQLAIEHGGEMIGGIRLGIVQPWFASIGYVLRRDHWGRGLVTEAAGLVVGFGFRTLGLHRIFAQCDVENVGSYRVMEKIGMRREGLLRENLKIAGRYRDSYIYAILEQEWPRAAPNA